MHVVKGHILIPHTWIKIPQYRLDGMKNSHNKILHIKVEVLVRILFKFPQKRPSSLGERAVSSRDKFLRNFHDLFLEIFMLGNHQIFLKIPYRVLVGALTGFGRI